MKEEHDQNNTQIMLPEASAGRAAAQFIVRSKGVGGAATNKQKVGFRRSGNRPFSFVGTTKHCLLP